VPVISGSLSLREARACHHRRMAKLTADDVAALDEVLDALRKSFPTYDVFLRYSVHDNGWQVSIGNALGDARWTAAGAPTPLADALRTQALTPLLRQITHNEQTARRRKKPVPRRRRRRSSQTRRTR
jgi:hypothetical protein